MEELRRQRIANYDLFYGSSEGTFRKLREDDSRAAKFHDYYMLTVCPGGRAPEKDKRTVDVFWGSRPYDSVTTGSSWQALVETGASLLFERLDNGFVLVSLYPAKTERMRLIESQIVLHFSLDPKKMLDKKFLKRLWNDFIAYTEYSSLDARPTLFQKLRVTYLHYFKRVVIEGKSLRPKIKDFGRNLLYYVLTVGLSGSIIYFLSVLQKPSSDTDNQLKEMNKKMDIIIKRIDSFSESVPTKKRK